MSSKTLCRCVRFAAVVAVICGVGLLIFFHIAIGGLTQEYSQYPSVVLWRIIVTVTSLPCAGVLACMWAVSNAIADDSVFTNKTAKWIGRSALLLFADAGLAFAVNVVMFFLSFSHPSILLVGLIVTFVFIAFGLLAAVLSRYIQKAADLQEINEGTI